MNVQNKSNNKICSKCTNSDYKNYGHCRLNITRGFIHSLFLCLLFTSISYSQQFSLGAKAGPLMTWASFGDKDDKDEYSHKPKFGYYVAGFVIFPLKNSYSFQAEFGFSQKGRKITFNDDTWENNATYYFADAAMMLRRSFPLSLGANISSTWFVNIGPHIGYWIQGNGKVEAGGAYKYDIVFTKMPENPDGPDFDKMYLSNVNRWLFGIDIGVGFNAPLTSKKKILTELRFTSGHTFFGERYSASNRTLGFIDNLRSNEKVISLTVAYVVDIDVKESRKGKSTKDKEVKHKRTRRR